MDGLDQHLSGRITALEQHLNGRITAVDQKVDRFREELSGRIDALGGRVDGLDQKLTRQFVWIVGIQVTVLITVVGALAAALFRG